MVFTSSRSISPRESRITLTPHSRDLVHAAFTRWQGEGRQRLPTHCTEDPPSTSDRAHHQIRARGNTTQTQVGQGLHFSDVPAFGEHRTEGLVQAERLDRTTDRAGGAGLRSRHAFCCFKNVSVTPREPRVRSLPDCCTAPASRSRS